MSRILGLDGRPMAPAPPRSARALAAAYSGADRHATELQGYQPSFGSADSDLLPERRDLVAGARDHGRNDGWITGGVQRLVDSVLGAAIRLQSRPDHRALGITVEDAHALGQQIETAYKRYANHPGRWCDAARQTNLAGVFGRAFRHRVIDGDALGVVQWRDNPTRYRTCLHVIDPDRLCNPDDGPDTDRLRSGVAIDGFSAAVGYHIRRAHPGDALFVGTALDAWTWDYLPRETPWGRPVVIHDFAMERAGQHRGKPALAPVIRQLRMVGKMSDLELQTAVRDALMGAFITSPYDPEMVESRMGESLKGYQEERLSFHERAPVRMNGLKIPVLFPGERPELLAPTRPNSGFQTFLQSFLRHIASALGLSYEQLSQDWSGVNYSSARAALLEVWRGFAARREEFINGVILPFFAAWLEEAIDIGDVRPPPGCADFSDEPAGWLNSVWIGPGRGWVDPEKEAKAAVLRLQAGLTTLERECAEQGLDYEEVLFQRKRELEMFKRLGLPVPSWGDISQLMGGAAAMTAAPSDAA